MKFVFGVFSLLLGSIEAGGVPKIQIYEIREKGNNGIELKNLNSFPSSQQRVESQLLRLLSPKKKGNKEEGVAEQLIEKLKEIKGEEGNRLTDDAYIYILHNILSGKNYIGSSSEEVFVDKTRNEASETEERIRNILEKLLRQNQKKPKHKKRFLLRSFKEDRTMPPRYKEPDPDKYMPHSFEAI